MLVENAIALIGGETDSPLTAAAKWAELHFEPGRQIAATRNAPGPLSIEFQLTNGVTWYSCQWHDAANKYSIVRC